MKDWEKPRWIPGQLTPSPQIFIPESYPEQERIILTSQMICTRCRLQMLGRQVDSWPDGYTTPFGHVSFLVEHPYYPDWFCEQDVDQWFCPNNAKRFFVSYPITVLEIDHACMVKQSIVNPAWKKWEAGKL